MSEEKAPNYTRNYRRQVTGTLMGGGIALMLYAVLPPLQSMLDLFTTVIFGAIIGVLLLGCPWYSL